MTDLVKDLSMKKIITVVGARPQFIKAAVVSRALAESGKFDEILVHTGQHFDPNMSDVFFDELSIPKPKYNLGIGGRSHAYNTGRAMEGIETVILEQRPDQILVYGDTDATLAGALAAAKLGVPIAHVEAGLRSFNRSMPEEINRVITDHLSSLLFAPSKVASDNLANEGISGDKVTIVGDVMRESVSRFVLLAKERTELLNQLNIKPNHYILATLHRKENTDDPDRMRSVFEGLSGASLQIIMPLHPRTRSRIAEYNLQLPYNITVIDPLGYLDMLLLESEARLIATDSGGVQKEAYFLHVPCIVLREETEWVELIDLGFNRLVGADAKAIKEALNEHVFRDVGDDIYGDGSASSFIVQKLLEY